MIKVVRLFVVAAVLALIFPAPATAQVVGTSADTPVHPETYLIEWVEDFVADDFDANVARFEIGALFKFDAQIWNPEEFYLYFFANYEVVDNVIVGPILWKFSHNGNVATGMLAEVIHAMHLTGPLAGTQVELTVDSTVVLQRTGTSWTVAAVHAATRLASGK